MNAGRVQENQELIEERCMIFMNKYGELIELRYDKKSPVKGAVYVKYLEGLKKGNYYIELEPDSLVRPIFH